MSLEELTKISVELNRKIAARKAQLEPLLKAMKQLKEDCETMESQYNAEKQRYDSAVLKSENDKMSLVSETDKLEVNLIHLVILG